MHERFATVHVEKFLIRPNFSWGGKANSLKKEPFSRFRDVAKPLQRFVTVLFSAQHRAPRPGANGYLLNIMLAAVSLLTIVGLSACNTSPDARAILDTCIATHGGAAFQYSLIEFEFRGKNYSAERRGGYFKYKRVFRDTARWVVDILDNDGFTRTINGQPDSLPPEQRRRLANSLNSVIYFALLPFPLQDPAVRARYLGSVAIRGEPYHHLEVTFEPEGGGEDYQDVFHYWIHREHHTLDYFAYRFHVNGGGVRFRAASNPRVRNGIRLADYLNYKPPDEKIVLDSLPNFYQNDRLIPVSEVKLENLRVNLLEKNPRKRIPR